MQRLPQEALRTVEMLVNAFEILQQHPKIGRPIGAIGSGLRELVISRGSSGYLALYEFDEVSDVVLVLAVRHQHEQDYH